MQNPKTTTVFAGTAEQAGKLEAVIEHHKNVPGALMPIMQYAQEIYGYLPLEVQTVIAERLEIPIEEVYSTATFYSQFALNPLGRHKVSICLGTACYVKGSGLVLDKIMEILGIENGETTKDGMFSLDACRCVGACGLAPVMLVDDDVYGRITPKDVEGILNKYKDS